MSNAIISIGALLLAASSTLSLAQLAPPATAPPKPAPSATTAPGAPATGKRSAKPAVRATERCMRLPLSDVAFGTEASIAAARVKLAEYATVVAKKRGWSSAPLVKSNETTSCEVYLDFGPLIGTEYRCLVTATFCQK